MTDAEMIAFEEIYKLWIGGGGKRERKTRRIVEEMIGAGRAAAIKAECLAQKQRASMAA